MIPRILVPLDGSKNSFRSLDMAIYLARQIHGTIVGIYVISYMPKSLYELEYPEKPLLITADKILEKAKKKCAQNGVLFEKKIRFGDPGTHIVNFANKLDFKLIVIGSRGMSGIKEMFLGSVSNHVLHKSKIPVLIVK